MLKSRPMALLVLSRNLLMQLRGGYRQAPSLALPCVHRTGRWPESCKRAPASCWPLLRRPRAPGPHPMARTPTPPQPIKMSTGPAVEVSAGHGHLKHHCPPHLMPSGCERGALVGGPSNVDTDVPGDRIRNDVALDYNAGFAGALASLINTGLRLAAASCDWDIYRSGQPGRCQPIQCSNRSDLCSGPHGPRASGLGHHCRHLHSAAAGLPIGGAYMVAWPCSHPLMKSQKAWHDLTNPCVFRRGI